MLNNRFIILVADSDPMVGVVAARLLSSALEARATSLSPIVRVLASQEELNLVHEPKLPPEVQAISQHVTIATSAEIEHAHLVVGFSGVNEAKVDGLRNAGLPLPAVNLCQFVLNLNEFTNRYAQRNSADLQDAIVGAALEFGFAEGVTQCAICADKAGDNLHYWINIADTCAKFAQLIQKFQE